MKKKLYYVCGLFFLVLSLTSCNWWKEVWGDHSLGANLSLLDGDRKEDQIIVYCSNRGSGICYGGVYVVPTYARHYDSNGKYAEYVESVKSNEKWVIVKTHRIEDKKDNYWLISKDFNIENTDCTKVNCDSILQSFVKGPFNRDEFIEKKDRLMIELNLE